MLMVRLQRVGRKHEPVFRLVLTDSKNSTKSGKFLEILGHFDARNSEKAIFDTEKIKNWVSKGAKLSDTVHNLLIERKVLDGKKINKLPKKTPISRSSEKPTQKEEPKAVEKPAEPVIEGAEEGKTKKEEGREVAEETVA